MLDKVVSDIVAKVFPTGTDYQLDCQNGSSKNLFWLVPGKGNEPRWILPSEHKFGDLFLHQWRPYDKLSRFKWGCLMGAYKGNMLGWVPDVIPLSIYVPHQSQWQHLGWFLDQPPVPVIYVGTPVPRRKVVFGLIDVQKNEVASIGKAPLGLMGGDSINYESEILDRMQKEKPGRAPRSLFVDRKNGIATQEFFSGSPTGRILTKHHVKFLIDLAIPGETISLREGLEDFRRQIKNLDHIDPEDRTVLERVLVEVDDPSLLPAVWEHGDFAPWNLKSASNGSLRAIDWEAASRRGLPLFDLVHFYSIQAFQFGEKELFPKSFRGLLSQYLERLGIAPGMTRKIIRACIARDWLRRHEEGDRPLAAFLLQTLASPLGDIA